MEAPRERSRSPPASFWLCGIGVGRRLRIRTRGTGNGFQLLLRGFVPELILQSR